MRGRWALRPRRVVLLAATCAMGGLAAPSQAAAQEAPLLTVGVDVTSASLTHATYSLLVVNRGNAPAGAVVLTNPVPARTTLSGSDREPLDPSTCGPGAAAGTSCRWALGAIPPGSSETVAVTYALEQSEAAYPASSQHSFSVTASAQLDGKPPAGTDPAHTDSSLVRTSHVLDQDAYTDDTRPDKNLNFGSCAQLLVRRDNAQTAFVDNDSVNAALGPHSSVEIFGGAELRAAVASTAGAPVQIGAHRVAAADWDEGTSCGGAGSDRQVRAASEPESETSPTASAPVAGSGPVRWNVTAALDTRDERNGFNGFELRGGDSSGAADDTVTFHSSDATVAADRPRLITISARRERANCIDSDPEETTGPSDREQRIDAYVTDGPGRVSNSGGDGCPGTPIAGAPVGWMVDDDSPDTYISSLAGEAVPRGVGSSGDAGPNHGSTRTGPDGRTFIATRLGDPYGEGANAGESRVAAIILNEDHDGANHDPSDIQTQGTCEPGDFDGRFDGKEWEGTILNPACGGNGEANVEDDVEMTWQPVSAQPPTRPPEPEPGPSGPSGQPAPGPSPPAAGARAVSLRASPESVRPGDDATLAGQLSASDVSCADAGELVRVLRRGAGGAFGELATVTAGADGRFELPVDVKESAGYMALAPAHGDCAEAASAPAAVRVTAQVIARSSRSKVGRGAPVAISGRVLPDHRGTEVILQRRRGGRWVEVASRPLAAGPRFSFRVRASWTGPRRFRVRWVSVQDDRLLDVSRAVKITARGP